jgi:predicted helicase
VASSIREVLAELYAGALDERDKGDKFERLMRAYLSTDATWVDRFSDVWLWSDWPGRGGKVDTGIDLVAAECDGGLVAIQCKFYAPTHVLQKADIDSFFTASGRAGFTGRMIVSTTTKWSKNAEDALIDQQISVTRLDIRDLDASTIDWSQFSLRTPEVLVVQAKKTLFPHQRDAFDAARAHYVEGGAERGKLIMACGTGKTFTSLRITEDLAGPGAKVLFLVPSISLLAQSLREWTQQAEVPLRCFAVCSDVRVGRNSESEDIAAHDLPLPATTDGSLLAERMAAVADPGVMTVVFSTYQSLAAVVTAQDFGIGEFDLVVCDEAHRTTGVTLAGEDESAFVKVHNQVILRAKRRLYMTATPRIYGEGSRQQAAEGAAKLCDMDEQADFGEEFHRLGFGEAVERNLLTDYKVLVLAVDEKAVSTTFQAQLADDDHDLGLDDAARIVGCWNGLAKRGQGEFGFGDDPQPMRRAVAFSRSIKDSKRFAALFTEIVDEHVHSLTDELDGEDAGSGGVGGSGPLHCEVDHVDGTFNVLRRNELLGWLQDETPEDTCRILSNARCLSEGVDVPALDAVLFLNPRNSVVDVVQSVGRVMRRAPGKRYGYVILPIGIPADMTPEQALADNKKYKVVWQVLQALRAHDERFNALINKIELNKASTARLQVIGVSGFERPDRQPAEGAGTGDGTSTRDRSGKSHPSKGTDGAAGSYATTQVEGMLSFPELGEWRAAIYARIVKKVGDRRYWDQWAAMVADIAERHTTRIKALLDDPALDVAGQFEEFLHGLRCNLNDSISRDDAIDMLAQHLITKPIFDALFDGYSFTEHNPVSQVMQAMLNVLHDQNLQAAQDGLEKFYASVRLRAADIDTAEGKQQIITELYEKFFKLAFPRVAEKLGIVYTPIEVVDFILRAVQHLLQTEFDGASLSDPGVHVLDPFTGTGTFIARLLTSGLIQPADLARKYASELHANEILLLAYYIAAINIEATYHGLTGYEYQPFDGIVLTDTFQIAEAGDVMDEIIFPTNNARVAHQKNLDIRVIIGNPPYSVGQTSANDASANLAYPTLDGKIESTYAARSMVTSKRTLYDSYIRAIRWASDRIASSAQGGVIGYVSNGGWIDANTTDGLRKSLAEEFHSIYVYNLRGNTRTAGEQVRREGGKIFGQGSRSTVAVTLLVKKPGAVPAGGAMIRYYDIGDYLTREEKLNLVAAAAVNTLPWDQIDPNEHGDWLNQRGAGFGAFPAVGAKGADRGGGDVVVFDTYTQGVNTGRDAWAYNYSRAAVETNASRMIEFYNSEVERYAAATADSPNVDVSKFLDADPKKISWADNAKADLKRGRNYVYSADAVRPGMYRPFCRQNVYFDRRFNERVYQLPKVFPSAEHSNFGIYSVGEGSAVPFSVLMLDGLPNLHVTGAGSSGQFFPRFTYERVEDVEGQLFVGEEPQEGAPEGWRRVDNITDAILTSYQKTYGTTVTKDDVFYYLYGLLHSPEYRERFAADLKRTLPRIPQVASAQDFDAFVDAGRRLAGLHVRYEEVQPYPLIEKWSGPQDNPDAYLVEKMRFAKNGKDVDKSTLLVNNRLTLAGVPPKAEQYQLGSRSAVEWLIDRYQVKTDPASGIRNDPNDWGREHGDPRYIVDLIKRVVTVSVQTVEIVRGLPSLDLS